MTSPRIAFLIPARDGQGVTAKQAELENMGFDYLIVCGEPLEGKNIIHREPAGKFDAINAGLSILLPKTDIVIFNDVDTKIREIHEPLSLLRDPSVSMVFCQVEVPTGPQRRFYRLLDLVRSFLPIASSGELVIARSSALAKVAPIPPTLSEDTWLLFKFHELGLRAIFFRGAAVTTRRTETYAEEVKYKRRTVCGIYQSLSMTHPSSVVLFFYGLLPFLAPILVLSGPGGRAWRQGIWYGIGDFLQGSKQGAFERIGGDPNSGGS